MSTTPTEAQIKLAYEIIFASEDGSASPMEAARLIRDSEVRAVEAALHGTSVDGLTLCGCKDHPHRTDLSCCKIRRADGTPLTISETFAALTAERERVRVLLKASTVAHSHDIAGSGEHASQLLAELARLRAEVERLNELSDNAASAMQWAKEEFADMKARADRAEAEALAQAELLGRSAEREADLLGKLSRAESVLTLYRSKLYRVKSILSSIDDDGMDQHHSATAERAEAVAAVPLTAMPSTTP